MMPPVGYRQLFAANSSVGSTGANLVHHPSLMNTGEGCGAVASRSDAEASLILSANELRLGKPWLCRMSEFGSTAGQSSPARPQPTRAEQANTSAVIAVRHCYSPEPRGRIPRVPVPRVVDLGLVVHQLPLVFVVVGANRSCGTTRVRLSGIGEPWRPQSPQEGAHHRTACRYALRNQPP
jgi:hypothetical protein